MIKYFCDLCPNEIKNDDTNMFVEYAIKEYIMLKGTKGMQGQFKQVKENYCKECTEKIKKFTEELKSNPS